MIINQNAKAEDIEVNIFITKHLTNTHFFSANVALFLRLPRQERASEFYI